jgi:predicted transposase YdaD
MSALQQMLEKAEARGHAQGLAQAREAQAQIRAEAQAREAQKNASIVKRLAALDLPTAKIAQIVELSEDEVRRILAE